MYLCCLWKSQQTNGVQESNVAGKWIFHRVGTAQRCAKMQNLGGGIPPVASRLNCPFMGSFFWADLGGNRGLDSNLWGWHRLKFTATSPAWWPRRRRRPAFGKGGGGDGIIFCHSVGTQWCAEMDRAATADGVLVYLSSDTGMSPYV